MKFWHIMGIVACCALAAWGPTMGLGIIAFVLLLAHIGYEFCKEKWDEVEKEMEEEEVQEAMETGDFSGITKLHPNPEEQRNNPSYLGKVDRWT